MGNMFEVLGSKAKLRGLGSKTTAAGSNKEFRAEPPVFGDFCTSLIKIPYFEAYLSLNFYENLFLSLLTNTREYSISQ